MILELKMCGGGYPTSYAFDGQEQILHYMENRDKKLGYLIVFDARRDQFGEGIKPVTCIGAYTVITKFIDVRPEVETPSRRRKRQAKPPQR